MEPPDDIVLHDVSNFLGTDHAEDGRLEATQTRSGQHEFSLPAADGGKDAWLFLAACFVVEALVWGQSIFISVPRYCGETNIRRLLLFPNLPHAVHDNYNIYALSWEDDVDSRFQEPLSLRVDKRGECRSH
jgi:hypothetical protein